MARVGQFIVGGCHYALLWWGMAIVLYLSNAGNLTTPPPFWAVSIVAVAYGVGMTLDVGALVRRGVGRYLTPTNHESTPPSGKP